MKSHARRLLFVFLLVSSATAVSAQRRGAEADPQAEGASPKDLAAVARAAGERALESGRLAEALRALTDSLVAAPGERATLRLLLRVAADDADARALWSQVLWDTLVDAEGRGEPTAEERRLLTPDDKLAAKVARSRVNAIEELLSFANEHEEAGAKRCEERLVARWARRSAAMLAEDAPALQAALDPRFDPQLTRDQDAHTKVLEALQKEIKAAFSKRQGGAALRLARVMRGLASQARFTDLMGPKPRGMERWMRSAGDAVARARELVAKAVGEPWSVDDLEWLTEEEGEAFTRAHDEWMYPGVALSPQAWYRVETVCGHGTLLGVAATIEDHHRRLAGWYGEDPFVDRYGDVRQGIVRIVPEAHGLEAEGAPFWWAGGFQGGDTTTMRFSCGTIEGLGHGLTHELTHRFDGNLFPGQPAWLTEGKAVWTGAAFGHSSDTTFVTDHASIGTIEAAFIKGYGGEGKLRQLVTGELEDYRDNYTAGYALYVFLESWRDEAGTRLFQARLRSFMETAAKGARDAQMHFDEHFCDGEGGRPASFEEFAALFGTYVRGFYWKSREPWVAWYATDVPSKPGNGFVYDEPTWVWSRNRAEPVFGQDQLREAGLLLLERGRDRDAVVALVEGLARDGRTPAVEQQLAGALADEGRRDAAWVLRALLALPDSQPAEAAPFLKRLSSTRAHLETVAEAVRAHEAAGRKRSAAALAADHARLARRLGLPNSDAAGALPRLDGHAVGELLHSFAAPAATLSRDGWTEDGLVGFEERRVAGLWYADDDGTLHVGRKRPRRATGSTDRAAHQRHAFARSVHYLQPGTYRVRAKVAFTTSYVSGHVVFGFEHRDRSLRFGFNAGDFLYAIGESDAEPTFESMGWGLSGGRDRDGPLGGSQRGGRHEFGGRRSAFDLELLIDGPAVQAWVDGAYLGRYHTVDGAPIEGSVGFATSMGAIHVRGVSVQRLDRLRLAGARDVAPLALDLDALDLPNFSDLENRTLLGFEPPSNGALLLWIPADYRDADEAFDPTRPLSRARSGAEDLTRQLRRNNLPQGFTVIVPAAVGEAALNELRTELAVAYETPPDIRTHRLDGRPRPNTDGTPGDEQADRSKRWLFFVDGHGILRVARPFLAQAGELEGRVVHWLDVFRDFGRPQRTLPEVVRASALEEEDAESQDD